MARPSNPGVRARLREQAIDYVMRHGFAAVTLRPIAKELKTNARMLVYHFGSREGLLREILIGLRMREDQVIHRWFLQEKTPQTLADFLRWYWRRMSAPKARPAALLIFELYALALRDPESYPGVLTDPIAYWRGLASKAGVSEKVEAEATLLLAATRGLLLDLTATNQRARIRGAVELLADLIDVAAARRKYALRRKARPKKTELRRPRHR
jgi:AcrR family transcriptional regulator